MYIIIKVYYKYGESEVETVADEEIRDYCLKKVIDYTESFGYNYDEDSDEDSDWNSKDLLIRSYHYATTELGAKKVYDTQKLNTERSFFLLDKLVKLLISVGDKIIEDQAGLGIRYIIHGDSNTNLYY